MADNDGDNNNGNQVLNQLLKDLQDPFASQVQATSIYFALGLSLGIMVFVVLVFSVFRPHHNAVYAPKLKHADKRHAPPPVGKGLFAWITPLMKTKEADLIDKIGMDAVLFLRFVRMLRTMFLLLTILGCAVLIPVHLIFSHEYGAWGQPLNKRQGTSGSESQQAKQEASALTKLTPQTVYGSPMWAHVVFAYLSDAIVLYFLFTNYKAVVRLRKAYFASPEYQNSVHGRSLMVRDIGRAERTDQGILKIVDSVTQVPSIPRTAIARNMKELPRLLEEHESSVRKLEAVLSKYLKNPDKLPINRPQMRARGRGRVDAIDFLTGRIQELEVKIRDVRETIDKRNPEAYGFASYESISDAHAVAWHARKRRFLGAKIELSPSPKDIIWKNMQLSRSARKRKRFVANFWVAILTAFYFFPNAFVAIFLADLSKLAGIWPAFYKVYTDPANRTLWGVVQALLAPTLFSLFYLFLPSIFRRISERAGDHTKTSRERHVTHKLYAFFVFNNLVVFSLFSTLWSFGSAIIQAAGSSKDVGEVALSQTAQLPSALLNSICNVSPFWVVWLLQRNIGSAIDLAQAWNMLVQWFKRVFFAPTPREQIELTAPPPFDYASWYHYFLYYGTVALTFSTIQPLVLPIVLLYFLADSVAKKYLLMYVFITKTESGGQFWNVLHNRILFMLLLQNIVGALVILGAQVPGASLQNNFIMIATMAPLPFILLGFKIWIGKTLAPQARFYTRSLQVYGDDNEAMNDTKKSIKAVSSRLLNPVMTKPLITPMVHARAQHALAQVYRGRMDEGVVGSDGAYDGQAAGGRYGDIPMSDMNKGKAGDITDMFEVVQENQLDFANFKNRAEFRDRFGGGGELYGRAWDAMTERSATPASFMTGGGNDHDSDDGLARYGTPEPVPAGVTHPAFRQTPQNRGPYGNNPAQGYNVPTPVNAGGFHRSDSFDSQGSVGGQAAAAAPPPGPPRPNFYRNQSSTDSARRLVNSGQPMGYAPVSGGGNGGNGGYGHGGYGSNVGTPAEEYNGHEMYGLDRWRTGGAGYNPVNNGDIGESGYEAYRRGHY